MSISSEKFSIQVIERLQEAGYQALWAGGCVRDRLLGRNPKDFDVATNARPEQVRDLFGTQRTLALGASFGVISVLGPRSAGPIEVATFRKDGGYSDGRRPDSVEYTDAREDALRRDFTINGMFFDPLTRQVLDFVGGQQDLQRECIRAIGDPHARIEEDKLRMLRGIRFASTLGFELEPKTLSAISDHAQQIQVVSGERIGNEMRRMLEGQGAHAAAQLLWETRLFVESLGRSLLEDAVEVRIAGLQESLERLPRPGFVAASFLLYEASLGELAPEDVPSWVSHWKLTNQEKQALTFVRRHWEVLAQAHRQPWSRIQPLLLHESIDDALEVVAARAGQGEGWKFCQSRLKWPDDQLNPEPLIDGADLLRLQIPRGPRFRDILHRIRNAQLDGEIKTLTEAEAAAQQLNQQWESE